MTPTERTSRALDDRAEEVDRLIEQGIRNRWYPLCPSSFVDGIARLVQAGEELVLWRDAHGRVNVLEDRCPHRGAPLSLGEHLGDRLACIYHGVEIAADGTVLSVPGSPGCALEGRRAVRVFPSEERAGAVFAWFGDALHAEPTALQLADELSDPTWSWMLCYVEWNAPARFVLENVLDPMHGTFLHRQSHSMSQGAVSADFRVRPTDTGFVFEKTDQRDVNFDWTEFADTGTLWLRLEIPYGPSVGPGGNFGIVAQATPISRDRSAVFFWRTRRVEGWERAVWRFLYRNRLESRHWAVLEQDRTLLEAMPADADRSEMLYRHDLGVSRLRKFLRHQARAQLRALAES